MSIKTYECPRKNLCIDCDDESCGHSGMPIADCPVYECEHEGAFYEDCCNCTLLKQHQRNMRRYYKKGDLDGSDSEN